MEPVRRPPPKARFTRADRHAVLQGEPAHRRWLTPSSRAAKSWCFPARDPEDRPAQAPPWSVPSPGGNRPCMVSRSRRSEGSRCGRSLQHALERHFRCVRIIHGKGLRSGHRGPVLKGAVSSVLRRVGPVLAYVSGAAGRRGHRCALRVASDRDEAGQSSRPPPAKGTNARPRGPALPRAIARPQHAGRSVSFGRQVSASPSSLHPRRLAAASKISRSTVVAKLPRVRRKRSTTASGSRVTTPGCAQPGVGCGALAPCRRPQPTRLARRQLRAHPALQLQARAPAMLGSAAAPHGPVG